MTKVYFSPVHLTHFYRNELKYSDKLPIAERVSHEILALPLYPTLTDKELDYIVKEISSFFTRRDLLPKL